MREAFKKQFGEGVTGEVFREIDQQVRDDENVLGEHVLRANLAALENISPALRLASQAIDARDGVSALKADINTAGKVLETIQDEVEERERDYEEYATKGSINPGLTEPLALAKAKRAEAQENLQKLRAELGEAEQHLSDTTAKLQAFNKALDQPLLAKEDEVRLTGLQTSTETSIASKKEKITALESRISALEDRVKDKESDLQMYADGPFTRVSAPGIWGELDAANAELTKAKEDLVAAKKQLSSSEASLVQIKEELTALKVGPSYRRAQKMLDNVGDDPRFMKLLDKLAPGKASGGALGKLESGFASITPGEVMKKVVTTAVAPLGVARFFYTAVKAEDRERRLDTAKGHMQEYPLAKGMAESLARANEKEKWQAGLQGTLSFVSMALTVKLPGVTSAMGALTGPLTSGLAHTVSEGAHSALGSIVGGATSMATDYAINSGPFSAVTKAVSKGMDQVPESHAEDLSSREIRSALNKLAVPDGTAMPMIPVKPFGPGSQIVRDLPLADPEVAVAFLTYLGPPADQAMLRDPGTREMETRRLTIREEMFGAKPTEDITPGEARDTRLEKQLVSELDSRGSVRPSSATVRQTSPLHLLTASMGLTYP